MKRIIGALIAAALFAYAAMPVSGLGLMRSSEPVVTDPPPIHSSEPTAAPTEAPTEAPTPAPTEAPTAAPTSTPRPTTPAPSQTTAPSPSAGTPAPTQAPSAAPTATPYGWSNPTQQPSYVAYSLWERAGETLQRVQAGTAFELMLVEGVSEYVRFSNFYGNLPATVEFVNSLDETGSCSLSGFIPRPGAYEFALEFQLRSGNKLMLNFSITAEDMTEPQSTSDADGFPQARPLVPFGGAPTACLPASRRKEDA